MIGKTKEHKSPELFVPLPWCKDHCSMCYAAHELTRSSAASNDEERPKPGVRGAKDAGLVENVFIKPWQACVHPSEPT